MVWLGVVVMFCAACAIEDNLVLCDDRRVCPVGSRCTPNGCLSSSQQAACEGLLDGDACADSALGPGVCQYGGCVVGRCGNAIVEGREVCDDGNTLNEDGCSGTCLSDESCGNGLAELDEECDCGDTQHPGTSSRCAGTYNGEAFCSSACTLRRCGDAQPDPGEVCDDGNNMPGDGCSFDCRSNETCANGIVDYFKSELCDDGNTRNRDGCAATCRPESIDWHEVVQTSRPPTRENTAGVYNAARGDFVIFGGDIGSQVFSADTWEYDSSLWTARPGTGPSARENHAMVYDSTRRRVILFGGEGIGLLDDTWEFDGTAWVELSPTTSPPARINHAMAYDPVRRKVVIVGGLPNIDTWELDGVTWTERVTANRPSAGAALAFNPVRGRVLAVSGTQMWELGDTDWTPRSATAYPPNGGSLIYDASRGQLVMLLATGELWGYTGTTWSLIPTTGTPTSGLSYYDAARKRIVIISQQSSIQLDFSEVWELVGSAWTLRQGTQTPDPRWIQALAYDAIRGVTVLFGGYVETATFGGDVDETWEFDGASWAQRTPAAKPSPRSMHAMVFDGQTTVLFGGAVASPTVYSDETWDYDGVTWTPRTLSPRPPGRYGHGMAYDSTRDKIVVFGGTGTGGRRSDTWELDANGWVQRQPMTVPPVRTDHSMAYDSRRQRVVMFGGTTSLGGYLNDTWEWDGTNWTQAALTGVVPVPRYFMSITYDSTRGRVVLFGGDATNYLNDTWEFDGTTWSRLAPMTVPTNRYAHSMVYDAIRGHVLMFGGYTELSGTLADTWTLGYTEGAAGETCRTGFDYDRDTLVGCADDECWGTCTPLCPPGTTGCPTMPTCGDNACSLVENCRNCPSDCAVGSTACPIECGDMYCDTGENATSCPGDCP